MFEDELMLDDFDDTSSSSFGGINFAPSAAHLSTRLPDAAKDEDDVFGDDDLFEATIMEESFIKNLQSNQAQTNGFLNRSLDTAPPTHRTSTQQPSSVQKKAETRRSRVWDQLLPKAKRKFPGPAGLLPRIVPGDRSLPHPDTDDDEDDEEDEIIPPSQQVTGDLSSCVVWQRALQELDMNKEEAPVKKYNTAWIQEHLRNPAESNFGSKKMPFFLAKIKSLDMLRLDPSCVLMDEKGEVAGSIIRQVLDIHADYLKPGSVLALKDVTVLLTVKCEYVVVTMESLIAIYSPRQVARVVSMTVAELESLASALDSARKAQLTEIDSERDDGNDANRIDSSMLSQNDGHNPLRYQRSTNPAHHYRPPEPLQSVAPAANIQNQTAVNNVSIQPRPAAAAASIPLTAAANKTSLQPAASNGSSCSRLTATETASTTPSVIDSPFLEPNFDLGEDFFSDDILCDIPAGGGDGNSGDGNGGGGGEIDNNPPLRRTSSSIILSNEDFGERTAARGGAQAPASADSGFLVPAPPKAKSKFMFKSSGSASSLKSAATSFRGTSSHQLSAVSGPEASNKSPPRNFASREERRERPAKPQEPLRPPATANRPLATTSTSTTPQRRQLNSAAAAPATPSGGASSGILLSSLGQASQKTATASQALIEDLISDLDDDLFSYF